HRVLGEAAKHFQRIIPASFESVFDEVQGVQHALATHCGEILGLLRTYGHQRQFSLTVRWDIGVMQQLTKLVKRFPKAGGASLETERRDLRDQILRMLQGSLSDLIILQNTSAETVLQSILLIDAAKEERVAGLLQSLDDECQGRLHMRLVGPLPACNFARVDIKLPNRDLVKKARQQLGIHRAEKLSVVKSAYRTKVKALRPEAPADKSQHETMVRLTRSYRYLAEVAAQQNLQNGNDPEKQWLRCDSKTLRHTPLFNIERGITRWDNVLIKRA
ncbi:MAG TPA: GvpL/GvpF family gas vesicle protein, partial [Alphaproteobacteria bacterium]|nr:GvpL/GvpF family gas vesicle protein [Alphaproteobacteria bacterium]